MGREKTFVSALAVLSGTSSAWGSGASVGAGVASGEGAALAERVASGAGDAFTSGILLGAHRDSTLEEALTYATAAAVASLRNGDASEGVLPLEEALKLLATFPRAQLA